MPNWIWDLTRYRDLDTGRWASGAQVRGWAEQAIEASINTATDEMAAMVSDGQLVARDWLCLLYTSPSPRD